MSAARVSGIGDLVQKCLKLEGATDGAVDVDIDMRVRVHPVIRNELVPIALGQRVAESAPSLELVADAPVEILCMTALAPDGAPRACR